MLRTIGQRGTLEIILRSYDASNIQCGTVQQRYTEWDKCDLLLETIPADLYPPQKWGPANSRGVDKVLPYSWGVDCRCWSYSPVSAFYQFVVVHRFGRLFICVRVHVITSIYLVYKCRLSIWGAGGNQNLVDDMTYYDMWTGT